MVCLQCPKCNGDIPLKDGMDFADCPYCGIRLQLTQKIRIIHDGTVRVEGISAVDSQLASARKMFEIEEYADAERILERVVDQAPDRAEAWLYLALIRHKMTVAQFMAAQSPDELRALAERTPQQIREMMIFRFVSSSEFNKARKLSDAEPQKELIQSVIAAYEKEIHGAFVLSQKRINAFKNDPRRLSAYQDGTDGGSRRIGFQEYRGKTYYFVNGKSAGTVEEINGSNEMVLLYYQIREWIFHIQRRVPQYYSVRILYAEEDRLFLSSGVVGKKR